MKYNTDSFIKRAIIVHGHQYDYDLVDYCNMKTKVEIVCPVHGSFWQTPDKHIYEKCGCPQCAGNTKLSNTTFIEKAREVHGDRYDYGLVNYQGNRVPVKIICFTHGIFEQRPGNHLLGKGCPKCANNVRSDAELFIEKARDVHGDRYDYSKVKYFNNRTPVIITCLEHGDFKQAPCSHLSGCGCPVCGRLSQKSNRNESEIEAKRRATFLLKYGVENPMDLPQVRDRQLKAVRSQAVREKSIITKRKNRSFNTSLSEYRLGVLLKNVFGENDVEHNYVSDVYPYQCDYYIKSRDLYIELNAHWSHGGHWYDDATDSETCNEWRTKSKFYQNCAETFSVRDVAKRNCARQYNLKYVVFWKTDLSDVKIWIDAGCPDGYDWIKEYSWL